MATETVAPDHTSTDKQFEKKVEEEANGQESVSLLNENEEKHDKAEDAQGQATPSSKTKEEAEGYEKKAEHDVLVEAEKSEDSPALEASVKDNLKHDKVEDGQSPAAPSSNTERDEKEAEPAVAAVEKVDGSPSSEALVSDNLKEEKELIPDAQTVSVTEPAPEAAKSMLEDEQPKIAEIPEVSVGTVEKLGGTAETNPLTESEVVKQTEYLEASSQEVDKPEPVVTEVQGKAKEPEKESQDKVQEAEQPNAVVISDPSAEINDKQHDGIEKPEPIITEVQEKSEEHGKESQEKTQEVEQPDTVAVSDLSAETNEKQSDTTENSELVVTEVREKLQEPEKSREAEKPNTVEVSDSDPVVATPECSAKTSEKLSDAMEEKTRETEFDAEVSKEAENYEARPTESEKAEPVVTETTKNPSEPEKQSSEKEEEQQQKTVIHQTESDSAEKPGDAVEVQPPQESDIEAVKETGDSNEIIMEPISLKEENDKVEETSITGSSAQVSSNEEAQAVTENLVESSPAAAEKVVQEGCTNEVEAVSKGHASTNQEAETELKEESEYSAPISVEEKVAANEDKKQAGAPEDSSREAEVEIKQVEEQNDAKTATAEGGDVKTENVTDERAVLDNEKRGQPEKNVDEGATVVTEQVRETLASKLEEKEEESVKTGVDNMKKVQIEEPVKSEVQTPETPTKESDATKTSKHIARETPAKPAQKQSNNILSKVKQSLVKAKKAIIGKSPTTKTVSSEAKGGVKSQIRG